MKRIFLSCVAFSGLVSLSPTDTQAQLFNRGGHHRGHHHAGYCDTCEMPQADCACSQPVPVVTMQTRPVVTTQMRAQQVTTYRDVSETRMRSQQVVENIPVTTYKNVTVDEGGYQMVWVARPVTKQVAQTIVQQQVKTVAVPVQVTRRIPQTTTQMIPVQTVQHVTEQVAAPMMTMPIAYQTAAVAGCDLCGNQQAFGMSMLAPQFGYAAPQYQYAPMTATAIPTMPPITVASPQTAYATTPYLQPEAAQWQNIPARPVPAPVPGGYETVPARSVPAPRDEATVPARKTSMFNGVPSAAAVWQLRGTSTR
jgi:hypothetical protein